MADEASTFMSKVWHAGHPGETQQDMLKDYTELANEWEQNLLSVNYQGHILANETMCKIYDDYGRKSINVLDVAAGTGIVGKVLRASGFAHIDALDPSEDMLAEARAQKVYEKYFYEFLTGKATSIKQDSYDALVGSGLFGHIHVPTEALFEMIRIVKPGGSIVLVTRHETVHIYETYKELEPTMDRLEREGKWRKVSRIIYPRYFNGKEAIVWHYEVL